MRIAVVGSGPSGVGAAQVLSHNGHEVDILDLGHEPDHHSIDLARRIREQHVPGQRIPNDLVEELRGHRGSVGQRLVAGISMLLRRRIDSHRVMKRILGSGFVFAGIDEGIPLEGSFIPRSLARGGLSNVWGAACYPFRPSELGEWPISPGALAPYYARAAAQLEVVQSRDDLERAYPLYGPLGESVEWNPSSALSKLLGRWEDAQEKLAKNGIVTGRSRLAVRPPGADRGCMHCGLCFHGCAYGSIYSASHSLDALIGANKVNYVKGVLVERFRESGERVKTYLLELPTGARRTAQYDALLLAAGPLSSLRVAADSLEWHERNTPLMDNDMYLLPLRILDRQCASQPTALFTLSEAVIAIEPGTVGPYGVHVQLYSFHEEFLSEVGSLLRQFPGAIRDGALGVLGHLAMGFLYLDGRQSRLATVSVQKAAPRGRLRIRTEENPKSAATFKRALELLGHFRSDLGFMPLGPLVKLSPFGFSGHVAGSIPMRPTSDGWGTAPNGRLHGTKRVYVVDSATLPTLPAQNLTFTVVANAMRIADQITH